jgi:hypothetical protein
MPISRDLLDQIAVTLPAAVTPNLIVGSRGDDLYEAYVWSVVVEAAVARGATITFKQVDGSTVTDAFHFRSSPSELWWNSHPYSHAEIDFGLARCPILEAHVGIYVAGKSAVRHECDVAVLHKSEAETCRRSRVLPRASKLLLAVECKYYILSRPGVALARGFLGLRDEIEKKDRFFVATSSSPSVAKILARHAKREHDLAFSPVTPHQVDVMRGSFEQVFAAFVAAYR